MDKAPSHIEKNIIKDLKEKKIIYSLIPEGMTRFLQPLDIGVNKIFKNYMKEEYIRYISNIMNNNIEDIEYKYNYSKEITNLSKPDIERGNIIKWVHKIWYDDELIKPSSIINSFKKSGISLLSDCSEEHLFEVPDEIRNSD